MMCVFCKHGQTRPGQVTVPLQRGNCIVIFKGVPAEVCENCGEYYLNETTTEHLLERADDAVKSGAEVEILRYVA